MIKELLKNMTFLGIFTALGGVCAAQQPSALTYADVADIAADAPIIVSVIIRKDIQVETGGGPVLPGGVRRHFIEAQVQQLIRGSAAIPPVIRFLTDLPLDMRGRNPKLKKQAFIVMGRPVAGRENEIQLVHPAAMLARVPENEALVRAIVQETVDIAAAPPVVGISSAFYVPGTINGEGESQFFLNTRTGDPISISVLRRPGQSREWAVSLGEIVDSAARQPSRNSLLWYRLACGPLPAQLPASATEGQEPQNRTEAAADYAFVRQSLGGCPRSH